MADISAITLPNGNTYSLKDSTARATATGSTNGLVLLSDSTAGSETAASGGTAATPKAVADALAAAKAYTDSAAGSGGASVTINTWTA